jgi:hypothetical protein
VVKASVDEEKTIMVNKLCNKHCNAANAAVVVVVVVVVAAAAAAAAAVVRSTSRSRQ